ncbi:SRPBCC family protein [Pontivivens insulae]|uniref:Polyketide cyclase / dehydrase and lipid transport n=1 Tax=Pontivivens insulae TaxID=1639689 RepID=A0A2R8AF67_9RHOB|nr:SRPBCC family protein [Pontivivens insulae]RED11934.1 polyketide cyclase/dehydrase/lipid transport protein [Pontivivens insulae]SPF30690.1 hypothetical protein POI8812_03032 [Pontivivens insulae]
MRRVTVSAVYDGSADEIFAAALNFDEMRAAMRGLAVYEGVPDGTVVEVGKPMTVDVTFWGVLKIKGHRMEVVEMDRAGRWLQSREAGGAIRHWDHRLSVQPRDDGTAVWTDRVDIDAGVQTAFMAQFARYLYKRRHRYRQALSIEGTIERLPK